jgi:hypothetical protein
MVELIRDVIRAQTIIQILSVRLQSTEEEGIILPGDWGPHPREYA